MKRTKTILASLLVGFLVTLELSAQCDPDTAGCKDIGNPGEFCPLDLPRAGLGILYDEVVTIIAPGSYLIPNFGEVNIDSIEIDSVKNLPPGID